jgi:putative transposase
MPKYHRFYEGGAYFFTVVTFNRLPILTSEAARGILHSAWLEVSKRMPFATVAVCLLPEHLHCVWSMQENDQNYSARWKEIKRRFTRGYLDQISPGEDRNASRQKRGEAAIWQRRFWEHVIRDQEDLERHMDYIHYNPVKHGLVKRVGDWPWSSFHRFARLGYYDLEWGAADEREVGMAFGE